MLIQRPAGTASKGGSDAVRDVKIFEINLTGTALGMQKTADAMIAAGGGSMIKVFSSEGSRGTPWAHGYVAEPATKPPAARWRDLKS